MENEIVSPAAYPAPVPTELKAHVKQSIPFSHKDIRKSLEEMVDSANNNPKRNSLEDMFADKAKTLKASVNALLEEIKLRQDLNAHQFKEMNGEICRQHTELMQLDNINDAYPENLTRELDEARARIKSVVLELEKEKRQESLDCWRDLMFLKKYLMVSLKDYWELTRKRRVLNG